MAEEEVYRALVGIDLADNNTIGRLDAILGQVESRMASLNIKAPIGTGVFAGIDTSATATIAMVNRLEAALGELNATKSVTGVGALSGGQVAEAESLAVATRGAIVALQEYAIAQQAAQMRSAQAAAAAEKEAAALVRVAEASARASAAPRIGGRFASAEQIAALPVAEKPVTSLGYGAVPMASGTNQLAGVGNSERVIALTAQVEQEERNLLTKTTAMTAAGATALQIEEATNVERLKVRGAIALVAEQQIKEAAAIAVQVKEKVKEIEAEMAAARPPMRRIVSPSPGGGVSMDGQMEAPIGGGNVITGLGIAAVRPDPSNMSALESAQRKAVAAAGTLKIALEANSGAVDKDTVAIEKAEAGYIDANIRLQKAIEREAIARTDVAAAVNVGASAKVQSLQTNIALAKTELAVLKEVGLGEDLLVRTNAARIKVLTLEERLVAVTEAEAKGTGGGGMGIGSALKYFAFYQLFTLAEQTMHHMITTTEEYSLAVNQLAISMNQTTAQVTPLAEKYATVGQSLATPPAVAINAGVALGRFFQDPGGPSGMIGAQLGSTIALLEAKSAKDGEEEALVRKRLDEVGAIAKNYDLGASGAADVYGMSTQIAQHYGQRMGGALTGGTAQMADLFKQGGFNPAQAMSTIAAVQQYSGTTSEAAAGDIKRVFGRQGSGTFASLFGAYDIGSTNKDGTTKLFIDQIKELGEKFKRLPEGGAEQKEIISTLGGGRSGSAALNLLQTFTEVLDTAKKADSTAGKNEANKQGQDKLETFAGQIEQIKGDLSNLALDLGKSGLGGVFGGLLQQVDPLIKGLDDVLKMLKSLPQGISPAIGALGAFALAVKLFGGTAKVTAALSTFAAGGSGVEKLSSKATTAANTAAIREHTLALQGEAEAEVVATRSATGFTVATDGTTVATTEATAAQIGLGEGELVASGGALKSIGAGLFGLAGAAGAATIALLPLIAGFALIEEFAKWKADRDKAKSASDWTAAGNQPYGAQDLKAIDNRIISAKAAISNAKSLETGSSGVLPGWLHLPAKGWDMPLPFGKSQHISTGASGEGEYVPVGPGAQGNLPGDDSLSFEQARQRKEHAANVAKLKLLQADRAAAVARIAAEKVTLASSAYFGEGYTTIPEGIDQMGTERLSPQESIKVLTDLLAHTDPSNRTQLGKELLPESGKSAIGTELTRIAGVAGKENDPAKQLADLKAAQTVVKAEQAKAAASGDAHAISAAEGDAQIINKPYFDLLFAQTNQRIASIKALQGDTKASRARIIAMMKGGLTQAASSGDIQATIAAIGIFSNVELKAFNLALQQQVNAVKIAQQAAVDMLKKARTAAGVAANKDIAASDDPRRQSIIANRDIQGTATPAEVKARADLDRTNKRLADLRGQQGTIASATSYADPTGSGTKFGGSGPTPAQIEEARLASLVIPGDPLSAATAAVAAAQYKVDHPKDQLEYWNSVKALHEAQYAYSQAQNTAADAAIAAGEIAGDPLSAAIGALKIAKNKAANAVGAAAKSDAAKGVKDANYAVSQGYESIKEARIASGEVSGDSLSAARGALAIARAKLSSAVGSAAYYTDLKGLRDAQYALAQAEQTHANDAFQLHLDLTNPVVVAREKVREATRQLAFDRGRGADTAKDRLQLKQDKSAAEKAAFDQTFSDHQTNFNLQRESLSAYLSYLHAQHNYLTHVHSKTRQQVDELNQVDQALKSLVDGMQGQFNLGSIKMPTPFEVRRSMATGASQAQTTVHININGADTGAIKGVLAQYLGQAAMATAGTSVRKV